jgi:signal transduction histidine kinase
MKQVLDKIARFSDGLMGHREDTSEAVPCDLNKLIVRLVDFLKPQNRFDGVAMVFQPDPALPDSCVRPGEIGQVLVNLLNNAADAIHLGGRREGRIEIAARRAPERDVVCITVRDNGPGLSNTAKSRIFRERYSEKKSGHGLGLLNCHAIARAHGGTLTVESAEGMGTTFTLTLPVASGESAPAAQTTAAATS